MSLMHADNQIAKEILLKAFHRIDGVNHIFKLDSRESNKKKQEKHFEVYINWPSEGDLLSQTRIVSINSKRKKPSSFWVHRYRDETKIKKWMSLPITGKLKDVSDKKSSRKEFSFSELSITDEEIDSQIHDLMPQEKIDSLVTYVINSKKIDKKGNIKESKILWIDIDSFMILKVEFYTGSGRLYRRITCTDFYSVKNILFPININVQDLKSKTDMHITLKDIDIDPEFDMDIFIPQNQ